MLPLLPKFQEETRVKYYLAELRKRSQKLFKSSLPDSLFQEICRFLGAQGIHDLARASKSLRHRISYNMNQPKLRMNPKIFRQDILEFLKKTNFQKILPEFIDALPFLQMARLDIDSEAHSPFLSPELPDSNHFERANAAVIFGRINNNAPYIAFHIRSYYPQANCIRDGVEMLFEKSPIICVKHFWHTIEGAIPSDIMIHTQDGLEPLFPQFYASESVTSEKLQDVPARISRLSTRELIPSKLSQIGQLRGAACFVMHSFIHNSNKAN